MLKAFPIQTLRIANILKSLSLQFFDNTSSISAHVAVNKHGQWHKVCSTVSTVSPNLSTDITRIPVLSIDGMSKKGYSFCSHPTTHLLTIYNTLKIPVYNYTIYNYFFCFS